MTLPTIDLSKLPFPAVIESLNFEALFDERKAALIAAYPDAQEALEYESEPLTKLLQENVYRELLLRQRINEAARAVMLAFSGGADLDQLAALFGVSRLADESDATFRLRVRDSMYQLSVAGPASAYASRARGAHNLVKDVLVTSPRPGDVLVTVLSQDGEASAEVIEAVDTALSADTVRPLCDNVIVESAAITAYHIVAAIETYPGPEGEIVRQAAIDACWEHNDETNRIGAEVTRSGLYAALRRAGVTSVELSSPPPTPGVDDILIAAQPMAAPKCLSVTVTTSVRNG